MVTEARNKQKKQENQQKLEAKLHDIEVKMIKFAGFFDIGKGDGIG